MFDASLGTHSTKFGICRTGRGPASVGNIPRFVLPVKEHTMNDTVCRQVGKATNGRGEVAVIFDAESVVRMMDIGIFRLCHRAKKQVRNALAHSLFTRQSEQTVEVLSQRIFGVDVRNVIAEVLHK